ncbi:MAG: aminodeoxychorismate synthase component I [Candidatus Desulforudis sp.]|nr:aminodeoxychorismate synthase component I [Desulforudis sp.]
MLVETLPWPGGAGGLYARLGDRPGLVILDSGMEPRDPCRFPSGRWCFVAFKPFAVLECRPEGHRLLSRDTVQRFRGDPFDLLQEILEAHALPAGPTPLPAGGIGFLSYGLRSFVEPLPARPDDLDLPLAWICFYDAVIALDRQEEVLYLTSTGIPARGPARNRRAAARMRELRDLVRSGGNAPSRPETVRAGGEGAVRSSFSRPDYLEAVYRVKEYIAAGDVYQVNLAQRFSVPWTGAPGALFARLCRSNPAPFAALVSGPGFAVVSASPERFLHLDPRSGLVHTRPIKGTRPRGATPADDARLARELQASAKDRAEHVMIVDLERNDLSRVAARASVQVSELLVLESFPTVWHLVSTVEAVLRPETGYAALLRAVFPGGSITGAPKIRAMEIIEELEPVPRGLYTGAIGYFGFDGGLDLNIAIRTVVLQGGRAWFHAGGGIVADSDPEAEYRETLDKARALFGVLGCKEGGAADAGLPERTDGAGR